MNRLAKLLCVLSAMLMLVGVNERRVGAAPQTAAPSFAMADAQILADIRDHSELMENLEHLTDAIGPRLTGSTELKRANDWTAEMFKKYGLTNVHLESYSIPHAWTRGIAKARILSPTQHPLTIAASAWSPNTKGTIRGPIVYFDAKKLEDFAKYQGKLKGAIVILQEPRVLSPPRPIDTNAEVYQPMEEPPPPAGLPPMPDPYDQYIATVKAQRAFLVQEGALAILRDSGKPQALLSMTDGNTEPFMIGELPSAFVTGEGYREIFRMLKKGPVEVELEIKSGMTSKPVQVFNTVADLKGSEKPDEIVMVGAHLDSWDLATGATDNGTGSMAVLEAARTLAKLNLKPKRTIRFVLFTGEEEGLIGSKAYVDAHKAELPKISGVLIHDSGTGRVLAIGMHDNYQARAAVDQVIAPLHELRMLEPTMAREFGTDSLSFDEVGIPGFYCAQDLAEYSETHHSQSDTFDKVWKDDINQGAGVLATWAYNTAELPDMLPRRAIGPAKSAGAGAAAPANTIDPTGGVTEAMVAMDKKIVEQVKADEVQIKKDLTYLTTNIGPRLTGSPQQIQASHWTEEQFKAAGLENPHLEPWTIANSWTRGSAYGRVTAPAPHEITVATLGWSPATTGTIKAGVVGVDADKVEDLEKYKGKLAGKIVLMGRPADLIPPENPILTPWGEGTIPVMAPKENHVFDYAAAMKYRLASRKLVAEEKAAAVLMGSEKMFGLLNMTSASRDYQAGAVPSAFAAREDYLHMWRLLDQGVPVEAELNLASTFSGKPVEVYNTVAEIRGNEKADEVVIIGAHLDSWDLGTGATDNGTGSAAVLEAARALKKLGVKPKRTIRFVLFTGEEQGLNGSRAYVAAHKAEMPKISAVLVDDSGTGKVLTVGLMGNYAVLETMHRLLYPLSDPVGIMEPTLRSEGGSDHVPFDDAGVPGFWCVQEVADYEKTHHSQADTLDRVRWDDLTEGAQVLAVFAYNVAELQHMLERKPAKK